MFKHVLVPVDGSLPATNALHNAIAVAKAFGATLTLVTVYEPFPFIAVGPDYGNAQSQYIEAERHEARRTIKSARQIAEDAGLTVNELVQENAKAWRGITEAVDISQADLIVMGSHGRSGLDKLLMGSVVQNVLQRTAIPVMVVRS